MKTPTKEITKALWDEGKSIAEIAKERSLVNTTIESHLAYYVGTGELGLEKFVDADKAKSITSLFEKNPDSGMSGVKEALGESVSWSEIRFVVQHLSYLDRSKEGQE